jgi:hypothetical protein
LGIEGRGGGVDGEEGGDREPRGPGPGSGGLDRARRRLSPIGLTVSTVPWLPATAE